MSDLSKKVQTSIDRLRGFCPEEGYYLAFSGGKDSVVIKALADMAGVKYDAHYRLTSVDPPELVRFVKDKHKDVEISIPRYDDGSRKTMWNLIPKKSVPPTRLVRYCCSELKEDGGDGRAVVTGVRWAESANRKNNQGIATVIDKRKSTHELLDTEDFYVNKQGGVVLVNDNAESRRMVESCIKRSKVSVNPIIDWTDADVWEFIHAEQVPYCGLYDDGFKRLGCIGCPMARKSGREKEFYRWKTYKQAYINSFEKMLNRRAESGKTDNRCRWNDAQSVFNWWMEYDILPGQIDLLEEDE